MKRAATLGMVLFFLFAVIASVQAGEVVQAGDLSIDSAWAPATVGFIRAGDAYMRIVNSGTSADSLVAAVTPVARRTRIRQWFIDDDGVTKIRTLDGLRIGPGETVILRPKDLTVKLMGLFDALRAGQEFPLTLRFERAGEVPVTIAVLAAEDAPAAAR
ncbi:MAG: copper chaperone PCu(A)C [Proteobacteria bacterium]|nr:copper chaperone PCu(A)C [Pseudomonadota bacterium]